MSRRWALIVAVSLSALFVVSASESRLLTVSAKADIVGSGATWQMTLTNTGTEAIRCMRTFAPSGVSFTSASGPPGTNLAPGGSAFSNGNLNLAPGASVTFQFGTTAQLNPGAPPSVHVSADCVRDFLAQVTVTIPTAPPPPTTTTQQKPCKCKKLTAKLDGTLLNKAPKLRPDKHDFGVGFRWFLTCSKGKGKCTAKIRFLPPKILAGTLPKPKQNLHLNIKKVTVTCGPTACKKSSTGRFQIKMLSREQLNKLFGRTLAYTLVLKCATNEQRIRVKVFVDQQGRLKRHP